MAEGSDQDFWLEERAEVVRQLRDSAGLTVRGLASRTSRAPQSWSAYENPGERRRIHPEVLQELIALAPSAPAELKRRAQRLLEQLEGDRAAASARTAAAGPDIPDSQEGAPETGPLSRPRAGSSAFLVWSRKKKGLALAGAALAVVGVAAFAFLREQYDDPSVTTEAMASASPSRTSPTPTPSPTTTPSTSPANTTAPESPPSSTTAPATSPPGAPAPPRQELTPSAEPTLSAKASPAPSTSCQRRKQYRVTERGNVVDEIDNPIGQVVPDERFIHDDSPEHPLNRSRLYGTVVGRDLDGYVMESKLAYERMVCV
ncbi:helix-turn-helix domain-containing protein [Streptomyces cupreus]|uniref:Uncharacterized protein n=1 Tax=Streptomyces cupreus TaxID=2759956 RepID=A0A7X1MFI5_9ACTN|nr:helix-turn-helix transcriptional regulator [Streptomyces cupreus]MBC2906745.1 hypothetical protein [Streptomyces cupreus]